MKIGRKREPAEHFHIGLKLSTNKVTRVYCVLRKFKTTRSKILFSSPFLKCALHIQMKKKPDSLSVLFSRLCFWVRTILFCFFCVSNLSPVINILVTGCSQCPSILQTDQSKGSAICTETSVNKRAKSVAQLLFF